MPKCVQCVFNAGIIFLLKPRFPSNLGLIKTLVKTHIMMYCFYVCFFIKKTPPPKIAGCFFLIIIFCIVQRPAKRRCWALGWLHRLGKNQIKQFGLFGLFWCFIFICGKRNLTKKNTIFANIVWNSFHFRLVIHILICRPVSSLFIQ